MLLLYVSCYIYIYIHAYIRILSLSPPPTVTWWVYNTVLGIGWLVGRPYSRRLGIGSSNLVPAAAAAKRSLVLLACTSRARGVIFIYYVYIYIYNVLGVRLYILYISAAVHVHNRTRVALSLQRRRTLVLPSCVSARVSSPRARRTKSAVCKTLLKGLCQIYRVAYTYIRVERTTGAVPTFVYTYIRTHVRM